MAKEETFFGDETTGSKKKDVKVTKRKYTKKVVAKKLVKTKSGFVTIEVPANFAFQIGLILGKQSNEKE